MVVDWRKQIDECYKNTEIMPIFHGSSIEQRLQLVLITKKLHELGYTNEKILNWFKLAGSDSISTIEDVEDLVETSKKRRWPKKHDFKIYITKDEIDYIDEINTSKENKSFLLATIAFTKMMQIKKKKPTFNIRDRSYIYYIATGTDDYWQGKQRYRWITQFITDLTSNKRMVVTNSTTSIKIYTGHRGGAIIKKLNTVIKADWINWEVKDGYCITTLEKDVKKLVDLAFHDLTAICPKCGKEFIVGSYSQTDLCPECYEKERFTSQKAIKQKYNLSDTRKNHGCNGTHDHGNRNKTPILKICKICGKEFIATSKCKRTMCEECYNESRKKSRRKK